MKVNSWAKPVLDDKDSEELVHIDIKREVESLVGCSDETTSLWKYSTKYFHLQTSEGIFLKVMRKDL